MTFQSVRELLATELTNDSVWQTFAYPPSTPLPNSVIILPGSPWMENLAIDRTSLKVNYVIKVTVNTADNAGELATLEGIIEGVVALLPSWCTLRSISSPSELQVGTAYLTVSDIYVDVAVTL